MIKLNVPYSEKDKAKALGARWDPNNKYWYIDDSIDVALFSKWIKNEHARFGDFRFHTIALLKSSRECYKCNHKGDVYAVVAKGYNIVGMGHGHEGSYKIFPFVNISDVQFWNHSVVKASTLMVGETMQVQDPHLLCRCPKCKAIHGNKFLHFGSDAIFNFSNDLYKRESVEYIELSGLDGKITAHSYIDTNFLDHMENPGFSVFELKEEGGKKLLKNIR